MALPSRYRFAVFVEKEGFEPLINRSGLMQRYDVAIFSTKGMSPIAARQLVDAVSGGRCYSTHRTRL